MSERFEDPVAFAPGAIPAGLDGPQMTVTVFPAPHRWASRGVPKTWAFTEVLHQATEPELWPGAETVLAGSHRLPAWSFARFRDDSRVVARDAGLAERETRDRVVDVNGLIVEYVDEPAVDGAHLLQWWGDHVFVACTTGFNELDMGDRPEGPRWRVFLPFSEPVDRETAERVARWVRHPRHDVGIVDASTEKVFRLVHAPAIGPGGYRWLANAGKLLDPRQALRELAAWGVLDTRVRAELDLEGTAFASAVDLFSHRRKTPLRRPTYPGPGLPTLEKRLGPLWPGRILAVTGTGGSGRTAMALQLAVPSAMAGLPVLFVLTRSGPEDIVARMLAAETGAPVSSLLQGEGEVDDALALLQAHCPGMHLWAPTASNRNLDELVRKVRAVHDAHRNIPPLLVVDGVEGWAVEDPERGARSLVAGLRDIARSGTLTPEWPGAAVLFVAALSGPLLTPGSLQEAWEQGTLDRGPFEADANSVLVLALRGQEALAVLAKNAVGVNGPVELGFDTVRGRFTPVADAETGG